MLAQGLFATPATYPVAMRVSTIPGDILDDNVSVPRGMALKIIGVPGERLEGSEHDATQDFVMVNGPVFAAPTGKAFLKNLKLLAGTTDKAEGAKTALSTVLQGIESLVEAFGGKSATLMQLGGHPETNPLGETYFTQAPLLYGEYIAKFALFPVSPRTDSTDQCQGRFVGQARWAAPGGDRLLPRPRRRLGAESPALHRPRDDACRGFDG